MHKVAKLFQDALKSLLLRSKSYWRFSNGAYQNCKCFPKIKLRNLGFFSMQVNWLMLWYF